MENTNEIKDAGQAKLPQGDKAIDISGNRVMMGAHHYQQQSTFASVWHFIRHFVEMCLVMCIGGGALIVLLLWGATQFGYPDLIQRFPELSLLVIALILSLVMIVWMRFRGMAWRPTLEMASTTIVVGILLVGLGRLGILLTSSLFHWMTTLACPAMLVPMLLRLDLYTGRAGHSMHAAHH